MAVRIHYILERIMHSVRVSFCLLLTLLLASFALSQTSSLHGIDTADLDRKSQPCDDFYEFANGTWRANNPIPASMTRWSKRWQAGETSRREWDCSRARYR